MPQLEQTVRDQKLDPHDNAISLRRKDIQVDTSENDVLVVAHDVVECWSTFCIHKCGMYLCTPVR